MGPYVDVEDCNDDGGDCGGNCDGMDNGFCDIDNFYEECYYDMTDCDACIELVKTEYFLDSDDYVDLHDYIGNGICDQKLNLWFCGFDGGDCEESNNVFEMTIGDGRRRRRKMREMEEKRRLIEKM